MSKFDHLVNRCQTLQASNDDTGSIESRIINRPVRRQALQNQVVRMDWAPPLKREHPVGVAILAVLGLCVGCIVGVML